ncbi:hypothetical protein PENTCL1PPCAC_6049 [Pristionchus entomophagus]|uniref:Uncharacterized protein n=1 Tax=Pristionchus entomophagus TaxID=358040 RepID=A0AAV5SUJ3_9BILA|nr:hypothetical protein PENTCL1PPCAC_6049 [Pristionchus entomophagus]
MGHGDYPLNEFAQRLAEVESRFAKELQSVIECFVQSRVDLPVKHLEDIGKCHSRRAKNLKKAIDSKKTDGVNLWKITNIYSASCVDEDDAMREIRASLRKHIRKEGMKVKINGEDMNNSYRRVVADDYRPLVSQAPVVNSKTVPSSLAPPRDPSPPLMTEIYDINGQATAEEKQRWLEMWRLQVEKEEKEREEVRRKLEKRQSMKIFGSTVTIGSIANLNLSSQISKFFGEKKTNQPVHETNIGGLGSPNPQRHAMDPSASHTHHDSSGAWAAPRPVGEDELVMKF